MSDQTDNTTEETTNETVTPLTMDYLKSIMDKHYSLFYVDYRDNLDNSLQEIQDSIQQQDWMPLDEAVYGDWLYDQQYDSVMEVIKNLKSELENDFDEDEIESFFEDNEEDIRITIEELDDSTPLKDLLRNTQDIVMFYDTGLWCDEPFGQDGVQETMDNIKELLKIQDNKYDNVLDMMIAQASYGGRFVVYFNADPEDMIEIGDNNTIVFSGNVSVAITDNYNGSGDDCTLKGITFELPLDAENLFVDKLIKYNYTYEVCGMSSNWCDDTGVSFKKVEDQKEAEKSSLAGFNNREKELNETFKNGGCTAGDMDMNRHRNTRYVNDYPCGTHCPKCGTFWID